MGTFITGGGPHKSRKELDSDVERFFFLLVGKKVSQEQWMKAPVRKKMIQGLPLPSTWLDQKYCASDSPDE